MSMLTHALTISARPRAFRASAVVGLMAGTIVIAGLLIAHVQLRFEIKDLLMESRNLQKQKEELASRATDLAAQVERAKGSGRVLEVAREELGMTPYNMADFGTMTIARERVEAWRECKPFAPPLPDSALESPGALARVEPSIAAMLEALKAKVAEDAAMKS